MGKMISRTDPVIQILRNNGKIYMDSVMDFEAPEGVVVNIESGEIN